jgi:hypothetical protein
MENRNMKQHVSFVGALHIGFGILGLLGALTIFIIFNFAQGFVELETEPFASEILSFLGGSISLLIMFFALLGIIGGIGLLSYKNWARILVLIVSAVNCLNIPIGTAKGIYSIWVLVNKETMQLFEHN